MKLVFIIGNAAVGKMTVGQELTKMTDLRLFHNHMSIEPILEIFGDFNRNAIKRFREMIFEEFAKSDKYGLIFTYMWAFDCQDDWDYIEHIRNIFNLSRIILNSIMWNSLHLKALGLKGMAVKTD